jgi:hypothetical protein
MSIAEKLTSIAAKNVLIDSGIESAKTTLATNLQTICRVPASDTETLTALAAKVGTAVPNVWRPDPLWDSLEDIVEGEIGFIVRDRDEFGNAERLVVNVVSTADFTISWGDGVTETFASGTNADHAYALNGGKLDSDGTTCYKCRISCESGSITAFSVQTILGTSNIYPSILYAEVKASEITTMSSAFSYCIRLQAVGDLYLPNCISMASAFYYCTSLQSVGYLSLPNCISMGSAFYLCSSLQSVGDLSLPVCTSMATAFTYCTSLQSVGDLNLPKCTSMSSTFTNCFSLQSVGDLSLPVCTSMANAFNLCASLQYVGDLSLPKCTNMSNAFYFCASLQSVGFITLPIDSAIDATGIAIRTASFPSFSTISMFSKITISGIANRLTILPALIFSSSSPFSGTAPQIDVSYTTLSQSAIVDIFNQLPALSGKQIKITGCTGAAELTSGDRAIATGKGWTVVE